MFQKYNPKSDFVLFSGVRGKIDVSVEVGSSVVPFELKTGKSSFGADHQGQVLLYTLMLSSLPHFSSFPVRDGMLTYLKNGSNHLVEGKPVALKGLIQLR